MPDSTKSIWRKDFGEPQSFVSKYETCEQPLDILEIIAVFETTGITLEKFVRLLEKVLAGKS
jgi:hypothetical protein